MKIVFYQEDGTVVDVVENVINPIAGSDSVTWDNGGIQGINCKFAIVEDDFIVGEMIGDDAVDFVITQKIDQVNENVRRACYKGFHSAATGYDFETAEHDQTNFSRRMLTTMNNQNVTTVAWKTADGVVRSLTREQFFAVCDELDQFITSKVNAGWKIKSNLRNCTTVPEAEQISLEVE